MVTKNDITKYDDDMLEIMQDPVQWANAHLKINPNDAGPRWYQEQILRHPHNRMVLRCGRRVGKCIVDSQRVLNSETGEYKSVDELYKEKNQNIDIFTMSENFKNVKSKTFYIEDNGIKDAYKVTTKSGHEIQLTDNHPLYTVKGWKEVRRLKVGDYIATPSSTPVFGKRVKSKNYLKLMAYVIGVGRIKDNLLILDIKKDFVVEDIKKICLEENIKLIQNTKQTYIFIDKDDFYKNKLLENKDSFPNEVYTYSEETLKEFLAYYCDIRGWVSRKKTGEFGISSPNKQLMRDLKHLFLRFGCLSNISIKNVGGKDTYQLLFNKRIHLKKFLEEIGIVYGIRDYESLLNSLSEVIPRDERIPKDIWQYIERRRKRKNMPRKKMTGNEDRRLRTDKGISRELLSIYAKNLKDDYLMDLANSDVIWEKIIDIEYVGEKQTYDIFVPETHNLVIEDVFVHNTWTMCAHMLWVAFTGNGGKIPSGATCVVATPYDNQARLIFDQLTQFINNNDVLKSSVESMTKNPYFIKFKNGGVIKLFTAGTKSGSEGGALRGQKADWLYMDKQTLSLYVVTHIE